MVELAISTLRPPDDPIGPKPDGPINLIGLRRCLALSWDRCSGGCWAVCGNDPFQSSGTMTSSNSSYAMLCLRAFRPTRDKVVKIQFHPTHPWLVAANANDHVFV
ncbi:Os06g0599050 [Oryza sativa Japonica Group]|uniref:Os06g0599050 protein n=1 Tax=Oryza sativa subsp. japonica TaxID=39947 RepID=A0A0P0WYF6_ORYSJ|nr:Os06g0599050 [Oryza sativa Japonica Group]